MEIKNLDIFVISAFFLILIIFLLYGSILFPNQKNEYAIYSDEYFSFKYPKNWQIYGEDKTNHHVVINSGEDELFDVFYEGIEVNVYTDDQRGYTIEEWENFEKENMIDSVLLSAQHTVFKNLSALQLEIEVDFSKEIGEKTSLTIIYFKNNERIYRIGYWIEPKKKSIYQPIINNILASFNIP